MGSFELEKVSVRRGTTRALVDVDLNIEAGEAIAFVGPSGAGKTTLLRLLAGHLRPEDGQIRFDGRAWDSASSVSSEHRSESELRRRRASTGFVYQDLRLVPNIRVLKNVLAGRLGQWSFLRSLAVMLRPSQDLVLEVYELLERLGIEEKLYQRTDSLSGGQQQRVALARALFQNPSVLLADEPVSSVDPARAKNLVTLLTEVSRERGLTLCVSLHDLALAKLFFPRLIGLRHGKIVYDGPPDGLDSETVEELYRLDPENAVEDVDADHAEDADAEP